jgi:hypothetical protein
MPLASRHPSIFEINTWVWLSDLSRKYGMCSDLACVPARGLKRRLTYSKQ